VYRVDLSRRAEKDLDRLPARGATRVIAALRELATEPRPRSASKLVAVEGYRIRVGEYRIIYDVDDVTRVVTVYRVRHRREAYRQE
jgi:mRNA interferase RelE/StbE